LTLLLDTDVFIDILRQLPAARSWLTALPDPPLLSGITVLEASFGAGSAAALRDVRALESQMQIVWPDAVDIEHSARFLAPLSLTHGVGALDAVTASIALRLNLTVAAFNVKHFRSIKGLSITRPYRQ
jgi:predicted nucleic acid-binding protein